MPEPIRIHFELDDTADPEAMRSAIEAEIATLEGLDMAEIVIEKPRMTGVEIAAMIGAGIVIAKSARQAIDVVSDIVESLTALVRNVKGLKAAIVETQDGGKRIEDLTSDDRESLAEA